MFVPNNLHPENVFVIQNLGTVEVRKQNANDTMDLHGGEELPEATVYPSVQASGDFH